jgi:hypothetical protein
MEAATLLHWCHLLHWTLKFLAIGKFAEFKKMGKKKHPLENESAQPPLQRGIRAWQSFL